MALATAALACGCVSLDDLSGGRVSPQPIPEGRGPTPASGAVTLAVSAPPALIAGASAAVRVTLSENRAGARIELVDLPRGVSAPVIDLAPGRLATDVVLSAIEDAAQGERDIAIRASGSALALSTSTRLFVRGRPGTADRTFGENGMARADFPGVGPDVFAVALQTDGKILVGGTTGSSGAVARFTSDGRADADFGVAGAVTSNLGAAARGVAVLPSGSIAIAGQRGEQSTLALLDGRGAVVTSVDVQSFAPARAFSLGLLPDGSIIAAGDVTLFAGSFFALARFRSWGEVDGAFAAGTVTQRIDGTASGVCVHTDGRIVATGSRADQGRQSGVWARFTSAGGLDATFGDAGVVRDQRAPTVVYRACAAQADGGSVHVGHTAQILPGSQRATLVRVSQNGELDAAFADAGARAFGNDSSLAAVALQPDGKIVAVGHAQGGKDLLLVRLGADGALDATFAEGGVLAHALDGTRSRGAALAMQSDGRIVVVLQGERGYAVTRFWP